MAAIEKICEYSGDYPGWLMYGYKRNHIQIMPEYRKLFRGKTAELIFFQSKEQNTFHVRDQLGIYSITCNQLDPDPRYERINGQLYYWAMDRRNPGKEIAKPLKEVQYYEYALVVPELPGRVNGIYMNWSYDKGAVIRKLKRLIGKNLVIKKSPLTYQQWREWKENGSIY